MSFDEDPRENECPCCNEYEKERVILQSKLDSAAKLMTEMINELHLRDTQILRIRAGRITPEAERLRIVTIASEQAKKGYPVRTWIEDNKPGKKDGK